MDIQPPISDWIHAFNTHNVSAILQLYTEDAELFDAGMKRPRCGRHEIERWFATRFATMPSITYTPGEHVFMGDGQAAINWTTTGRGPRPLGLAWLSRPFRVEGVSVFRLQDGLIAWQRGYYDHLTVLEQLLPPLRWLSFPRL